MDLAKFLGEEFVLKVQDISPDELCEHMVRHIETEIIDKQQKLDPEFVMEVLVLATLQHQKLDNVVCVNRNDAGAKFTGRVTIVGDLHGQYHDLRFLLSPHGPIGFPSPENQVIFNGDMVDRGDMSVEIVVILSLISVLCPGSVHMLQGNHEAERYLNDLLGFTDELESKFPGEYLLHAVFYALFKALPVAAVIDNAVFVVHGGLGRNTDTIANINNAENDRTQKLVRGSLLHELLWNDPVKHSRAVYFGTNPNGRGEAFGAATTAAFLMNNNLKLLVRSHEFCEQGYVKLHNDLCYTVFSAANYSGTDRNKGAVLQFTHPHHTTPTVVQFKGHHYPTRLPSELIKFYASLITAPTFVAADASAGDAASVRTTTTHVCMDFIEVKNRRGKRGKGGGGKNVW